MSKSVDLFIKMSKGKCLGKFEKWGKHIHSQRDDTEASKVSCPAIHIERSTSHVRTREPWTPNSYEKPKVSGAEIARLSTPSHYRKNILEKPWLEYHLKWKIFSVFIGTEVRARASKVLLVVELYFIEAYSLKFTWSKVSKGARFWKDGEIGLPP